MEADGESEVQKRSRFRWIDAARYGVASVVAVLIISVIVSAIEVVLRPASLSLSVIGGAVFSRQQTQPPPTLLFDLDLRARNPSGRARMYYLNITVYLFDNSTPPLSPRPIPDSIMSFTMNDEALDQLGKVDMLRRVTETRGQMTETWFDMLYGRTGAAIADVTMRVDGVLVTELHSGFNKTRQATYLCEPLVVVAGDRDDEAYQNLQDVRCMEQASNVL
jgi:hypothetical protein